MKKLLIFASGSSEGGGSGFQKLVEASRNGILNADIVGVVSNHEIGGVRKRADELGIPFRLFKGSWTAEEYRKISEEFQADYVALSGWLKIVAGLDPAKTINIHPGPLPEFGGPGLYGHYVHEKVLKAFQEGAIKNSAVSMHFVTEEYDKGPLFFEYPISIEENDTAESLRMRVNQAEHEWQPKITNLVLEEKISWDGKNPKTLRVPEGYGFLPKP